MTNYVIIDLETQGQKTYKRFCNALDTNNYIVAVAYKFKGQDAQVDYSAVGIPPQHAFDNIDLSNVDVIVCHNAKFDLLYLWRSKYLRDWLIAGGRVYCTMQAEYLLRGQQGIAHNKGKSNGLSLDALAIKYGGTLKDGEVKDVWANGGTTLDIPEQQLIEYAKYDVINTEIILLNQIRQASKLGMLNIIDVYNDHLLAIVEMEFNGMYINKDAAMLMSEEVNSLLTSIETKIRSLFANHELWPDDLLEFKMTSSQHLANLFFGGSASIVERKAVLDDDGKEIRFKTGAKKGQIKTRLEKSEIYITGLGEKFLESWRTEKGGRGVGEDVIKELLSITSNTITKTICQLLLEHREHSKVLSTYLYKKKGNTESGLVPLIHPDGCVHSDYQTTRTETGRLSSTHPNLQNVPPSVIHLFESRFGKEGIIVEADFSQLEVCVQAYITQCDQMIKDIENGIDFHVLRLSYAENKSYEETLKLCKESEEWKLKRKHAKVISFQKSYGAHTSKIAAETGLSEKVIENIFLKEDLRYPEIPEYYNDIVDTLESKQEFSDRPLDVKVDGEYVTNYQMKTYTAKYQSITGKLYTFYKKSMQTKRGLYQYWPMPNVMNYPIQGTAADIVAMQVGKVFRYMMNNREKGLIINEIHDSIILDIKEEYLDIITSNIKKILEDVKGSFKDKFNLNFNVPIKVDVGFGSTWKECK